MLLNFRLFVFLSAQFHHSSAFVPMYSESNTVPPNSPVLTTSSLPPYEAPGISLTNITQPVNQGAIRDALRHLANDPRLAQMTFDIRGLGRTTFDVQRLPFPIVQAMVILGLALNTEGDLQNE